MRFYSFLRAGECKQDIGEVYEVLPIEEYFKVDNCSEPQIHHRYSRDEAIAFFRSTEAALEAYDGQWVIFPHAILCFAVVDGHPHRGSFPRSNAFTWSTRKTLSMLDSDCFAFLPAEVRSTQHSERWLFAKRQEWEDYMLVGKLDRSRSAGHEQTTRYASFRFTPVLPSALWRKLNGMSPTLPDHTKLDKTLLQLGPNSNSDDRFGALKQLVEYWYGPIMPEDAFIESDLWGLQMPRALRSWYLLAGRHKSIMDDFLVHFASPVELRQEEGKLVFYWGEMLGGPFWGSPLEGDDPQVFVRETYPRTPWRAEPLTITELMLSNILDNAITTAPYGADAHNLQAETIAAITEPMSPLAIPEKDGENTTYYVKDGVYVLSGSGSIYIGAMSEHPLQHLRSYMDLNKWQHIAF